MNMNSEYEYQLMNISLKQITYTLNIQNRSHTYSINNITKS